MISLLPVPKQNQPLTGCFKVDSKRPVGVVLQPDGSAQDSLIAHSSWLRSFCQRDLFAKTKIEFEVTDATTAKVVLVAKPEIPVEGFELVVLPDRIEIASSGIDTVGWQYGMLILFQMLWDLKRQGGNELECVAIADEPEFQWRGLHLDVCRHFFDVQFIKRLLDLMALHRLNRFHWHLTEDQGWRLDVPSLPKLAEISAWRQQDDQKYGGYYVRDDIEQIVQYSAERGITVVPEIELPGHSVAALAAYPQLACRPRDFAVETQWGVFDDVYCAGNEATFEFLQQVMDYVIELFPGDVIHIGVVR